MIEKFRTNAVSVDGNCDRKISVVEICWCVVWQGTNGNWYVQCLSIHRSRMKIALPSVLTLKKVSKSLCTYRVSGNCYVQCVSALEGIVLDSFRCCKNMF